MSFEVKGIALFYGAFRRIVIPLPYHSGSPRNLLVHIDVATNLRPQGGADDIDVAGENALMRSGATRGQEYSKNMSNEGAGDRLGARNGSGRR